MKWPVKPDPKEGDLRHKTRFLFFPKTIDRQARWLELATWAEECRIVTYRLPKSNWTELVWIPISWRERK
jgi:hypothetical protein